MGLLRARSAVLAVAGAVDPGPYQLPKKRHRNSLEIRAKQAVLRSDASPPKPGTRRTKLQIY
jgi:hypothetical protein